MEERAILHSTWKEHAKQMVAIERVRAREGHDKTWGQSISRPE